MIRLFLALINGIPYRYRQVWYNQSIWMEDRKYPIVFDKEGKYIDACVGGLTLMYSNKNGKLAYYKITNIKRQIGGDWHYPSDAYNVDLVFSHISKEV